VITTLSAQCSMAIHILYHKSKLNEAEPNLLKKEIFWPTDWLAQCSTK